MILGRDILSSIIEVKKHVGVIPDISNLYDELSAKENLLFMAKLYGVPKMLRERFRHICEFFCPNGLPSPISVSCYEVAQEEI